MPPKRRRFSKFGRQNSGSVSATAAAASEDDNPKGETNEQKKDDKHANAANNDDSSSLPATTNRKNKNKKGASSAPSNPSNNVDHNTNTDVSMDDIEMTTGTTTTTTTFTMSPSSNKKKKIKKKEASMVLTSDKRRGVYECDYCHADISQVPRISCAVCPEFDLCLDCFATTDHRAAIARLKTLGEVHDAVRANSGVGGDAEASQPTSATPNKTNAAGVSAAAIHHDETHGYRVADSTRYILFPATRSLVQQQQQPQPQQRPGSSMNVVDDGNSKDGSEGAMEVNKGEHTEKYAAKMEIEGMEQKSTTSDADDNGDKPKEKDDGNDDENNESSDEKKEDGEKASETENDESDKVDIVDSNNDTSVKNISEQDAKNEDEDIVSEKERNGSEHLYNTDMVFVQDADPKSAWTVEEDLRLLDAIKTCGLGNWADIAEAIAGNGSQNKSAKRCMERYLDDFLGRYGQILPPYTVVEEAESDSEDNNMGITVGDSLMMEETKSESDAISRSSKRRRTDRNLMRSQSMPCGGRRRKVKVMPTSTLAGYEELWSDPYLPPVGNVEIGQEVGREQTLRAENTYVKSLSNIASRKEAEELRKEWMENRMKQPHPPHVLPPRLEDVAAMPGSELAGFMPRRGDFDTEWDNDAENIVADMEFSPNDLPQDRQLKIQVIQVYNAKLDERERRKNFLLNQNLLDYRKNQQIDQQLPSDERDLLRRMRLFERLHTPEEHKLFVADLLKAKRLRKEIAKLQMYRRMGISTLAEAEEYELDKNRREFHKMAQLQKQQEAEKQQNAAAKHAAGKEAIHAAMGAAGDDLTSSSSSLWKKYKTSGRKDRRSVNRTGSNLSESEHNTTSINAAPTTPKESSEENTPKHNGNVDENKKNDNEKTVTEKTNKEDSTEESSSSDAVTSTKPPTVTFDIINSHGYELLSPKEVSLCEKLQLLPSHYLEIKKALIQQALHSGLLDKESGSSGGVGSGNKRIMVKIDAEKRGDIVDFMLRAGWISSKVGLVNSVSTATTS